MSSIVLFLRFYLTSESVADSIFVCGTISSIEGYMTDTSIYGVVDKFEQSLRDQLAKTSGYDRLATYSNFARGTEGATAWYSQWKLPKLSALKKKWDPKELFSYNKPIPITKHRVPVDTSDRS